MYQNGAVGQSADANQNGVVTMSVVSEKSLTAPQEIRARRMQSTQDAARLDVAGGRKEFAPMLQELRQSPARIAGHLVVQRCHLLPGAAFGPGAALD